MTKDEIKAKLLATLVQLAPDVTEGPWNYETDDLDGSTIFVDEFEDGEKPNPCIIIAEKLHQGNSTGKVENGAGDAALICFVRNNIEHIITALEG